MTEHRGNPILIGIHLLTRSGFKEGFVNVDLSQFDSITDRVARAKAKAQGLLVLLFLHCFTGAVILQFRGFSCFTFFQFLLFTCTILHFQYRETYRIFNTP